MGSGLCSCNRDENNNGNPITIKADVLLADNYANKINLSKHQVEKNIVKKNQESETNGNNIHHIENDENDDNNNQKPEENNNENFEKEIFQKMKKKMKKRI